MTVITTAPGETILGLNIAGDANLSRVLVEHGDGRWSLCVVRDKLVKDYPKRPVEAECTFTIADILETARQAFISDPAIQHDRFAGKKLAAGVLMFSQACGLIDAQEKAT